MKRRGATYLAKPSVSQEDLTKPNDIYNNLGLLPSLSPGTKKTVSSTTNSAISSGIIVVQDTITLNGKEVGIEAIERNTKDTMHALEPIFNKKKLEEKEELATQFVKLAMNALHNWKPKDTKGRIEKSLVHGLVTELGARIAGNRAGSGFYAGFTNEMLTKEITKLSQGRPDVAQGLSAALGGMVNKVAGYDAQTGAFSAQAGTKWNEYETLPDIKEKILEFLSKEDNKGLKDSHYRIFTGIKDGKQVAVAVNKHGVAIDITGALHTMKDSNEIWGNNVSPYLSNVRFPVYENGKKTEKFHIFSFGEYDGNLLSVWGNSGDLGKYNMYKGNILEKTNKGYYISNGYYVPSKDIPKELLKIKELKKVDESKVKVNYVDGMYIASTIKDHISMNIGENAALFLYGSTTKRRYLDTLENDEPYTLKGIEIGKDIGKLGLGIGYSTFRDPENNVYEVYSGRIGKDLYEVNLKDNFFAPVNLTRGFGLAIKSSKINNPKVFSDNRYSLVGEIGSTILGYGYNYELEINPEINEKGLPINGGEKQDLDTTSTIDVGININYSKKIVGAFTSEAEAMLNRKFISKSYEMQAIGVSGESNGWKLFRNKLNGSLYLIRENITGISKHEISTDGHKSYYLPESSFVLYEEVRNERNKKMVKK